VRKAQVLQWVAPAGFRRAKSSHPHLHHHPKPTHVLYLPPALTMFSAASRRLPLVRPAAGRRLFHASAPAFVKVGDKLPDVDLVEGSPGNKVNLAKELTGKGVIVGEPPTLPISIKDASA
jgi:hypothetical protein